MSTWSTRRAWGSSLTERGLNRVRDEVHAHDQGRDGQGIEQNLPPVTRSDLAVVLRDLKPPVGRWRLDPEAQEGQCRHGEDRVPEPDSELDQDGSQDVGE